MVVKALVGEVLAVALKALEVITSCVPAPAVTLSELVVADVVPLALAVSV